MAVWKRILKIAVQRHLVMIAFLITAPVFGCVRNRDRSDDFAMQQYHPLPRIEISMVTAADRIVCAYVRHTEGAILLDLSSDNTDTACDSAICRAESVVTLSSSRYIRFHSTTYENFDESFDMFGDGRVILVPLPEADGKSVGVFVNLLSGRRYFLIPQLKSRESVAKIRWLGVTRREVTVIAPEGPKVKDDLPQFPEFQR